MLVNLYTSKTPLSIFTLPLMAGLVALSLLFKPVALQHYFFDWQTDLFGMIQSMAWLNFLLAGALISLNAMQLNHVFNRNAFFSKDTFLPGFIYILGLATFDCVDFSPLLVAHLFVIGGLSFLLPLKRQEPSKNLVFMGSLLLGLAIVFSPLLISLALLPWISLLIVRPFIWRDWVIALLGLGLPVFYHYTCCFLITGSWQIKQLDMTLHDPPGTVWTISQSAAYLLMAACLLMGLVRFWSVIRGQLVNFKKISQIILFTLILSAAGFIAGWYAYGHQYVGFLIPVAVIISVQLLYAERPRIAKTLVNSWFVASLLSLFLN